MLKKYDKYRMKLFKIFTISICLLCILAVSYLALKNFQFKQYMKGVSDSELVKEDGIFF